MNGATQNTTADSASNPEGIQAEKDRLELVKLRQEVCNLRLWWVSPLIGAAPTLVAIIVTFSVAWYSGLIDAKRERITIESLRLEEKEKNSRMEKELLEREINGLKRKLEPYTDIERQAAARQAVHELIKRTFPCSRASFGAIILSSIELESDEYGSPVIPSGISVTAAPELAQVLNAINKLPDVYYLQVIGLKLHEDELRQIRSIPNVRFVANAIDDVCIESLWTTELRSLTLARQMLQKVPSLDGALKLHRLQIESDSPLDHTNLQCLADCKNLHTLHLTASINDEAVPQLMACPNLVRIVLCGNKLTEKGVRAFATHPKLKNISLWECNPSILDTVSPLLTSDLRIKMKELNPNLDIFVSRSKMPCH